MQVFTKIPREPLCRFIEHMWIVKGVLPYKRDKILPNGTMEFILNFGSPFRVFATDGDHRFKVNTRAWIVGNRDTYILSEPFAESDLMGCRFKPGGAYPFFKFPVSELKGDIVELDLILGNRIELLKERLSQEPLPDGKFALFESFLHHEMQPNLESNPIVSHALNYLIHRPGEGSVKALSRDLGYSVKQTTRIVSRHAGLNPKALQRVFRFQSLLNRIEAASDINWARLSAQSHFFDQAHMAKEMKHFTGLAPNQYLRQKSEVLNFIPIF